MPKIKYSHKVFKQINKYEVVKEIRDSKASSPEFRREVRRIFQIANRRIQNVEAKGLISPAVESLNKSDISSYSKFSISRLGNDWQAIKREYARAIAFINQPTSSATGAREYEHHLQSRYNLTDTEFAMMKRKLLKVLTSVRESDFVERYLMRYKDFTGELEQAVANAADNIETDAESLERALDAAIDDEAEAAIQRAKAIERTQAAIAKMEAGFSKWRG